MILYLRYNYYTMPPRTNHQTVKTLPSGYLHAGSVTLTKTSDLLPMLLWSVALPVLLLPLIVLVLWASGSLDGTVSFTIDSLRQGFALVGGILLVTIVMLIVHEGLHGLVFWLTTGAVPKFTLKFYYASASPGDWYLPRRPFMLATLLPLVAISLLCLLLLPIAGAYLRYLLILLAVFNASGAAGDLVVALRLSRLPEDVLVKDSGAEVSFFGPSPPR